jgi:hypothetical protein
MKCALERHGVFVDSIQLIPAGLKVKLSLTSFNSVRALLSAQVYSNIGGHEWSQSNLPGRDGEVVFSRFLILGSKEKVTADFRSLMHWMVHSLVEIGDLTLLEGQALKLEIDGSSTESWR